MQNQLSVILIHTCGIPRYSCGGHVALVIFSAQKILLTELHVRREINNRRRSCCEYNVRLIFTNTLHIKIETEVDERAKDRIREIYFNSLKIGSYCEKWSSSADKLALLEKIIRLKKEQSDKEQHKFCMMGKKIGWFFSPNSYNCVDYAKSILESADIIEPSQSVALNELENYLPELKIPQSPKMLKML
jgi:hypothetical protein